MNNVLAFIFVLGLALVFLFVSFKLIKLFFPNWSPLKKTIVSVAVFGISWFSFINLFSSEKFTGDPKKDAVIMYERVYKDGEDSEAVFHELCQFYIDKGYGMQKASDAMMELGLIISDN